MLDMRVTHTTEEVVFNWTHNDNPVEFRTPANKYIQLVCTNCLVAVPLVVSDAPCHCAGCRKLIERKGLNHGPTDYGLWVSYLGTWRVKDYYRILLVDGTVIDAAYPNARSWQSYTNQNRHITDDMVLAIQLLPDDELPSKYNYTGASRAERNIRYFGDTFPKADDVTRAYGKCRILI